MIQMTILLSCFYVFVRFLGISMNLLNQNSKNFTVASKCRGHCFDINTCETFMLLIEMVGRIQLLIILVGTYMYKHTNQNGQKDNTIPNTTCTMAWKLNKRQLISNVSCQSNYNPQLLKLLASTHCNVYIELLSSLNIIIIKIAVTLVKKKGDFQNVHCEVYRVCIIVGELHLDLPYMTIREIKFK